MAHRGSERRVAAGRFDRLRDWLRGVARRDRRGDDRRPNGQETPDEIRARTEQWLLYCQSIHRREARGGRA